MTVVFLTGFKCGLRPVFLIRTVGILLTLQADAYMLGIGKTMFPGYLRISTNPLEVSRLYLNTWFVGEHLHKDATLGTIE